MCSGVVLGSIASYSVVLHSVVLCPLHDDINSSTTLHVGFVTSLAPAGRALGAVLGAQALPAPGLSRQGCHGKVAMAGLSCNLTEGSGLCPGLCGWACCPFVPHPSFCPALKV